MFILFVYLFICLFMYQKHETLDVGAWFVNQTLLCTHTHAHTHTHTGCAFVTYSTRKAAVDAQNVLHEKKTLPGVSWQHLGVGALVGG